MANRNLFLLVSIVVLAAVVLFPTGYGEILNYDNPNCVVNSTLEPEEEGNYIDCNTPEAIRDNKTRCCDVEGAKGCCGEETKSDKMIAIGTSIGVVTVAMMTACFIVFWCNPDTVPCLKRCPCKCCKRGTDEFSEMTDLTDDIKKVGQNNQMYLRDNDMDEYAPPERYDMPEELKGEVKDDWWGHAGASSF